MEVFPQGEKTDTTERGLLHVRGGVSKLKASDVSTLGSSPRPWRCFRRRPRFSRGSLVFSTSVEVFLPRVLFMVLIHRLLHVRGGVSKGRTTSHKGALSSPRPWRCFSSAEAVSGSKVVFSTSVEVFPDRRIYRCEPVPLLHVRGGVSQGRSSFVLPTVSSPRPWRCFSPQPLRSLPIRVFSTSVEVFPRSDATRWRADGLLHVRGGVSYEIELTEDDLLSSPRPWRCFLSRGYARVGDPVFSTSVEVFL